MTNVIEHEKEAYTVAEVSQKIGLSRQTVTRLFEKERGVIILERPETLRKRGYRNIRIPHAVYQRVIGRLSNG
jgi:AraC-like DNA-binding protein